MNFFYASVLFAPMKECIDFFLLIQTTRTNKQIQKKGSVLKEQIYKKGSSMNDNSLIFLTPLSLFVAYFGSGGGNIRPAADIWPIKIHELARMT